MRRQSDQVSLRRKLVAVSGYFAFVNISDGDSPGEFVPGGKCVRDRDMEIRTKRGQEAGIPLALLHASLLNGSAGTIIRCSEQTSRKAGTQSYGATTGIARYASRAASGQTSTVGRLAFRFSGQRRRSDLA